ncbi:Uncharacterised protein [Bordetella pertussis]|nr:Uncharacterised protein [Bordetella pertussis]
MAVRIARDRGWRGIGTVVLRGAHLLTYGATRGEALRRAYQALAKLPGLAQADRAFLMDRIASPAFCSGLTGSQLDRIAS